MQKWFLNGENMRIQRIAFVCSTYVQLMRVFQLKTTTETFYGDADLYLVHEMFNNEEFIARLKSTKIFKNVYYFDVTEHKRAKLLFYIWGSKYKNVLRKYSYDKVVSFNVEEVISEALFNINKRNNGFEYHCIEDGPGAYEVYKPKNYGWLHIYKWLGIKKPFYNINKWWTGCPEYMEFPEGIDLNIVKLPNIDIKNYKLLEKLNFVFNYEEDSDLNKVDCLIMEESHYTDGLLPENDDFILYKKIIKSYPNIKFAIKLHPRTKRNRFENLVPTINNSSMPWELILWNRIISEQPELFQLSIACATMTSDKFLFDYEGTKMLLANIFINKLKSIDGYMRVNKNTVAKYEKIKNLYKNPDKFMLPKNEEEMFRMLDILCIEKKMENRR